MNKKRIIAVHLLNDFSGSPRVFANALQVLSKNGNKIALLTSEGPGFLDGTETKNRKTIPYVRSGNKFITLFNFLFANFYVFLQIWNERKKSDIIYVNTLLPFGAAIAGRLLGKKVVYHLHEVSLSPKFLQELLLFIMKRTSKLMIPVSDFVNDHLSLPKSKSIIISNALDSAFFQKAISYSKKDPYPPSKILMICSLKAYKGIWEYLKLAAINPEYSFSLVLNASLEEIKKFFGSNTVPENLALFPATRNVHPFYEKADLVLNLSIPELWTETFGLTIAEAMAYGIPVIVPPVGGVAHLVKNGENGYHCHSLDTNRLTRLCVEILGSPERHHAYSKNARNRALDFSPKCFSKNLLNLFLKLD